MPLVVRGGERVGHGLGDLKNPVERQPTVGYHAIERLPFDELHRQEVHALGFLDREDGDDVRVIERGERLAPRDGSAPGDRSARPAPARSA